MHLLILGATGKSGGPAYKYALEQGHHVTALVRDASKLAPHANLTIVEGSPTSEADMDRAVAAAGIPVDAALQFLNSPRVSGSPFAKFVGPPRLLADSSACAAKALRKQQPQPAGHKPRLVNMNAIGAGQSRPVAPFIAKLLVDYTNIGKTYKDHDQVDAEIEGNCGGAVDWTIVYATNLDDKPAKPVKAFPHTDKGFGFSITRESCARWMVDVATGKLGDQWSSKRVVISN